MPTSGEGGKKKKNSPQVVSEGKIKRVDGSLGIRHVGRKEASTREKKDDDS